MVPDPEKLVGSTIDGYQLVRQIGTGGAGVVFLGQRTEGEQVAIKILLPAVRISPSDLDALRQRFLREAQVLAQLRHPNILPVLAYGADPVSGHFYMVMPYMSNGTLADRLEKGPLSFEDTQRYVTEIAAALDYAHAQGIVHRDIKPANVLLDDQDHAVLADFGIAKVVDTLGFTLTATGAVLGTPEYMAIEQIQGDNKAISAQTDVYGLGVLAYHLLTGKRPYSGATPQAVILAIARSEPPAPRDLRADLPAPAEATLLKAMARDSAQRFETTGAFAAALAEALNGTWPASVPRPSAAPPTQSSGVLPTVTPPMHITPPEASFGAAGIGGMQSPPQATTPPTAPPGMPWPPQPYGAPGYWPTQPGGALWMPPPQVGGAPPPQRRNHTVRNIVLVAVALVIALALCTTGVAVAGNSLLGVASIATATTAPSAPPLNTLVIPTATSVPPTATAAPPPPATATPRPAPTPTFTAVPVINVTGSWLGSGGNYEGTGNACYTLALSQAAGSVTVSGSFGVYVPCGASGGVIAVAGTLTGSQLNLSSGTAYAPTTVDTLTLLLPTSGSGCPVTTLTLTYIAPTTLSGTISCPAISSSATVAFALQ